MQQQKYTLDQLKLAQTNAQKAGRTKDVELLSRYIETHPDNVSVGENLKRTFLGAVRDTAQSTLDLAKDVTKLKTGVDLKPYVLPEVKEPTNLPLSMTRDVAGFMIPYAGLSRYYKAGKAAQTMAGKIGQAAVKGSVAEQFAFNPDEERLSNLVQKYPNLQNPVTEYLQANPNDPIAEKRFKMALEGTGIAIPLDVLFRGFSKIRKRGKPQDEVVEVKPEEQIGEKPISSDTIDVTSTVEQAKQQVNPQIQPSIKTDTDSFAGNINLNKIDSPEGVKNVIRDTAKQNKDFIEARRGVVPFGSQGEELQAAAADLGMTFDDVTKRKIGQAFNAEEIYATRMIHNQTANEVFNLSTKLQKKVKAGEILEKQDIIDFQHAVTKNTAVQEQLAGMTAESGRALRQFREMGSSEGAIKARLIKDFFENAPDENTVMAQIEGIVKLADDPQKMATHIRNTHKATTLDKVQEGWINALLSAPPTHMVNIMSNSLVAATQPIEYTVAAGLGALRKKGSDKITLSEVGARIYGSILGSLDGLKAGWKALKDPDSIEDPLTKIEARRSNAISGVKGKIVRIPTRLLAAEDVFFKGIGYRQELWGQALRKAKKEGKGFNRAVEIMDDPAKNFPKIHLKAQDSARILTFTNELGDISKIPQSFLKKVPILRFIAPFYRTPVNIVKYAGQRTPLGRFGSKYKEAIKKGGAEADLARAKIITGTSTMVAAGYLASQGYITGRGGDFKENNIRRETGWQPYSFKLGNGYYAYNRFEPVGIMFGLAADFQDIISKGLAGDLESEELGSLLLASISENLTDKTFFAGISNVIQAISDPDRYGEAFINSLAGSFVPTISAYARKGEDPYVRDAQDIVDTIYNRIPILSEDLPIKTNVFGEPIEYPKGAAPDFLGNLGKTFSPIKKTQETNDPVFKELVRLEMTPSMPRRKLGNVELSPTQYASLNNEMLNLGVKEQIKQLLQTPLYKALPTFKKKEEINKIINEGKRLARDLTINKYPTLKKAIYDQKLNEMTQ